MNLRILACALAVVSLLFAEAVVQRYSEKTSGSKNWHAITFGAEVSASGQSWNFQDFAAHLNCCRYIWRHATDRPYTAAGHSALYTAWLGTTPPGTLAFAYSPITLLIALPFLSLPVPLAYLLFITIGVLALLLALRSLAASESLQKQPLFYLIIVIGSASYFTAIGAGQTALITTAGFMLAWKKLYDPKSGVWNALTVGTATILGILLYLFAAKPNLALTLGVLYLAAGAWRPVLGAGLAFALTLVLLSPWIGGWPQGPLDYIHFLASYNQESISPLFRQAIDARIYSNLQGALAQIHGLSAALAAQINYLFWIGGTLAALGTVRLTSRFHPRTFLEIHLTLFLLFCPSVNATEDILIALLVFISPFFREARHWPLKGALLFVAVNFNQILGLGQNTLLAAWPLPFLAKGALALWATWDRCRKDHSIHET